VRVSRTYDEGCGSPAAGVGSEDGTVFVVNGDFFIDGEFKAHLKQRKETIQFASDLLLRFSLLNTYS